MPKISRSDSNIFDIPKACAVDKKGYVYANVNNKYVPNKDGSGKHSTHDKKCIGISIDRKKMYANSSYFLLYRKDSLPVAPLKYDSVTVGPHAVIKELADRGGLIDTLAKVFDEEESQLILDLASYMVVQESAIFQHYPTYARGHALFSNVIRDDSYISSFLKENVSISKINAFKQTWAKVSLGSGKLYLCYDSTNSNTSAEGVYIIQKGYAKDDPTINQVNTEYVIRQEDGLPFTYKIFPGSIIDMTEAPEMIQYIHELTDGMKVKIIAVCDRGYISEENIDSFDDNGIGFILLLKSNMREYDELITKYGSEVKERSKQYIAKYNVYGKTFKGTLLNSTKERYFHIYWDSAIAESERNAVISRADGQESKIRNAINRKTKYSANEIKNLSRWFKLETVKSGQLKTNARGRGKGKEKLEDAFIITGYERDSDAIDNDISKCGFSILATSEETTAAESYESYSKRDCIEKTFRALKSSLGMYSIGVHSEESIHGKAFIWFIASILRSMIFMKTNSLRIKDKKRYTVPAILNALDAIKADRDLNTNKYVRRYRSDKTQTAIFTACEIKDDDIYDAISTL